MGVKKFHEHMNTCATKHAHKACFTKALYCIVVENELHVWHLVRLSGLLLQLSKGFPTAEDCALHSALDTGRRPY